MTNFTPICVPENKPADDLTVIDGIGPGISRALNLAGIAHFAQLAALSTDDVAALEATGSFKGRNDWQGWIAQAEKLRPPNASELAQGRAALGDDPSKPNTPSGAAAATALTNDAPRATTTDAGAAGNTVASAEGETIDVPWGEPAPYAVAAGSVSLVVRSRSAKGRRRAGMAFTREETVLRLVDIDPVRGEQITGDPELIVKVRIPKPPV
jgi:hypothetical protein